MDGNVAAARYQACARNLLVRVICPVVVIGSQETLAGAITGLQKSPRFTVRNAGFPVALQLRMMSLHQRPLHAMAPWLC
ncbi:MAG: hypothetical protein ACI83P_001556 [Janthinobacterium sp.]|jgi:hypothetical protein